MTRFYAPHEDRREVAPVAWAPAGLEACELVSPPTLRDACAILARAEASGLGTALLAGGTDWVVDRHLVDVSKAREVHLVIDLGRIDELREVHAYARAGESRLLLGAGVSYWRCRKDPSIAGAIPMLACMARDVGAVQIQTRGTLGGNLASASPAADGVAAMMALEAEVTLSSAQGTRTVGIDEFFLGYRKTVIGRREILTRVDLRVPKPGATVRWQKVGTRRAQAISKVALASVVEVVDGVLTRVRFGMASVAATTAPLRSLRAALEGRPLAEVARTEIDAALEQDIAPIDDVRSTGEYRLHVAKALVWRALPSFDFSPLRDRMPVMT